MNRFTIDVRILQIQQDGQQSLLVQATSKNNHRDGGKQEYISHRVIEELEWKLARNFRAMLTEAAISAVGDVVRAQLRNSLPVPEEKATK